MRIVTKPVGLFLAFLCAFSGVAYALIIHSHHAGAALGRFIMWCPGFAALSTCLLLRIPFGSLGWGWPARRYLKLSYFLPLIYAAPVYLLTWLVIRGSFSLVSYENTMTAVYALSRWPALGTFGVALPLLFTIGVIATKHSSLPKGTVNPQAELLGHKKEGFGLSWNPHEAGKLATGSEDKTVRLW